jgi:adenylosuccinate lyase
LRNIGVGIGHAVVAYKSILKGLNKLEVNSAKMTADLNNAWEILAEPIQMVMRVHGIDEPYEKLKMLTRGKETTQKDLHKFIDSVNLPEDIKSKLKTLTPADYVGYAGVLAEEI